MKEPRFLTPLVRDDPLPKNKKNKRTIYWKIETVQIPRLWLVGIKIRWSAIGWSR